MSETLVFNEQEQALLDFHTANPGASLHQALEALQLQEADEMILALWGHLKLQTASTSNQQTQYRVKEVVFDA